MLDEIVGIPHRWTGSVDIDTLAEAWRRRSARRREERLSRAESARHKARRAAAALRQEFAVDEVWLFGSLTSEPRHDDFDIDLAVRGLRPADYFAALSVVCEIAGEAVDLVTLETASKRVLGAVEATGTRIDDG